MTFDQENQSNIQLYEYKKEMISSSAWIAIAIILRTSEEMNGKKFFDDTSLTTGDVNHLKQPMSRIDGSI